MGFMLQSQTIKIINVDNKIQTEKEMRKHGNMLPIFIRDIICGPSNWQNKRVDKFVGKSTRCVTKSGHISI